MWDWNVLASWDGGKTWPATPGRCWDHCPGDEGGGPGTIGEGGAAYNLGASNHVILMHHDDIYHSSSGARMLNTRGVSSFNDQKTNNTRILARKTCI